MHAAFPQYFVTGANKPPAIFLISGVWYSNQKSRLFFVGIEMIRFGDFSTFSLTMWQCALAKLRHDPSSSQRTRLQGCTISVV